MDVPAHESRYRAVEVSNPAR